MSERGKGWDDVKNGSIAENIFDRSVHKVLGKCRRETDGITIVPALVSGMMAADGRRGVPGMYAHAVIKAANDIASKGERILGISLHILLPEEESEQGLRMILKEIRGVCETRHIRVLKTCTQVSPAIAMPLVTVTGYGEHMKAEGMVNAERMHAKGQTEENQNRVKPDKTWNIVMTKWAAIEGTVRLAKERPERIVKRLPVAFLRYAEEMEELLSIVPECEIALQNGAKALRPVGEGGVFAALWELGRQTGMGLEADLMQIPIRQETVEICEIFDINPYQLAGSGALLLVTEQGGEMCRILREKGIPSAVIGKMTQGNDRIIRRGEERRYIESSIEDEIFRKYPPDKKAD